MSQKSGLSRAARRNQFRYKSKEWPGRLAIREDYKTPADVTLNRSQHWSYAPTYEEAKAMAPEKIEVDKTQHFFVATLSNGKTSKKLNGFSDVIEWLCLQETEGSIPEKITIRRKGYGEQTPGKDSNYVAPQE